MPHRERILRMYDLRHTYGQKGVDAGRVDVKFLIYNIGATCAYSPEAAHELVGTGGVAKDLGARVDEHGFVEKVADTTCREEVADGDTIVLDAPSEMIADPRVLIRGEAHPADR